MTRSETATATTTCAVTGGGPAGIMLGLLLARAGVHVTVLEKHGDFLRDFRGDTVHPSTQQVLEELGLLAAMNAIPHRKLDRVRFATAERTLVEIRLDDVPGRHNRIAMIPQWDLLTLLTEHAQRYPGFRLLMNTEAHGLIEEDGAVRGVRYRDSGGEHELRAVLTVAADGRRSTLRRAAGLVPEELGAPMDVLWLRVSRRTEDPQGLNGRLGQGAMVAAIDRGDYWQIGYLVRKGSYSQLRDRGIEALRKSLLALMPFLGERVREVDWDTVAFLEVGLDRLPHWSVPGLVCIGDAAHTMSPIGGIGINLAVQDAVATANLLAEPLHRAQADPDRFTRTLNPALVDRVQRRRELPTRGAQRLQRLAQRQVVERALGSPDPRVPAVVNAVTASRLWRVVLGRFLLYGIRPEHVRSSERA